MEGVLPPAPPFLIVCSKYIPGQNVKYLCKLGVCAKTTVQSAITLQLLNCCLNASGMVACIVSIEDHIANGCN